MKVLLGVCGGVAAYKSAELLRELQRRGAEVQVVMTPGAERFVTPLTFASLSGQQVLTSLWRPATSEVAAESPAPFDIEHIRVGQENDILVIAPATANFIAKLAYGMTDDLLSTICLAATIPLVVAPAMNVNMWHHPATQHNMDVLRRRGVHIVAPSDGELACGMVGEGRLAEPASIADEICARAGQSRDLAGETILITAGGTREPIDPVRHIGNRSSGKMGFALAHAALKRGAEVVLITAALAPAELLCERVNVTTATEMEKAVLANLPRCSAVMMAAAVSDYKVVNPSPQKLKKKDVLTLNLTPHADILRQVVASRRPGTLVIGFAAETENVLQESRRKLREKGVDAIVANDVSTPGSGFESDNNKGVFVTEQEEVVLPLSTKFEMANRIFDRLIALRARAV